jgi:two-component system, LytTR family, response regulator
MPLNEEIPLSSRTAVLIDDEPGALAVMQLLLQKHCIQVNIVGKTSNSVEGAALIKARKPDIVFLDIEMPQLNGFQVLEQVADIDFHLIFTTAYDQYAVQAFRYSAVDYLLKPIVAEDLVNAMKRLELRSKGNREQVQALEQNIQSIRNHQLPDRITLPHTRGYIFQKTADIIYCEAHNTYTKFYIEGKEPLMISKPLGDVEEMLQGGCFFRTHRQYLVNIQKITELLRTDGGFLLMSDGQEIPIVRTRRQELLDMMKVY